jgi:putative heme-binding domain-containing protein
MRNTDSRETAIKLALAALSLQTPHEVQQIAVEELTALNTADTAAVLLNRWRSFGPSVRQEVLAAVIARPKLTEALLERLEQGEIRPGEINTALRQRLLNSGSDRYRRRARLIFGESESGDRQKIVREFATVSVMKTDSARGRDVFMQKCATCHTAEGQGHAVGPDLAALSDRSTSGLLAAILDPSRAIEPRYTLYQAITHDGRSYTGILVAESAAQIELAEQENRRHVIPRGDLEELISSGKSLMPDGFEKDLTRQQLADLIAYLQNPLASNRSPK